MATNKDNKRETARDLEIKKLKAIALETGDNVESPVFGLLVKRDGTVWEWNGESFQRT